MSDTSRSEFVREIHVRDKVVVVPLATLEHIESSHVDLGYGSIFRPSASARYLEAIADLELDAARRVYECVVPRVGFDLVVASERAATFPDARWDTVHKLERGVSYAVPRVRTSLPLEAFATDTLSLVIAPVEDPRTALETQSELSSATGSARLFVLLSAWPGFGGIPPVSEWSGRFAVVVPDGAQ